MVKRFLITKEKLQSYEKAQAWVFTNSPQQPRPLSWARYKKSGLPIEEYIFIHDHYAEIKGMKVYEEQVNRFK